MDDEPLTLQHDSKSLCEAYAAGVAREDPAMAVRAKAAADEAVALGGATRPRSSAQAWSSISPPGAR